MRPDLRKWNRKLWPRKLIYNPDWLVLGVNNTCNLHCRMCDVGTGFTASQFSTHLTGAEPLNMPEELLNEIIDQAAKYFPQSRLGYAFTEPLIYPHLLSTLDYAASKNIYTAVTTNGLVLDRLAENLVESGLNALYVSLDGPPEIHNKIRGHTRSFERAMAGIEKILALQNSKGKIEISVYCTITPWNTGYLLEFLKCFDDLPLQEIGMMHLNFTTESLAAVHNEKFSQNYPATISNISDCEPREIDLPQLAAEIEQIKKTVWPFPVRFVPEINGTEELHRFYWHERSFFGSACTDAFSNLMIKSDGTVIPAHGRCYDVVAGNIHEKPLKDIWNAKPLQDFRRTLNREGGLLPACSRCCSGFNAMKVPINQQPKSQ